MKLILRADVDHLGRLGEIVKVKPGYGRNYLIPRGLAMPATESNQRVFEQERNKLQAHMESVRAEARSLGDKIAALSLEIPMRVGEGDKLYGSVTSVMLAEAMEKALGQSVDRRKILLEEPIRSLGAFTVPVKLHQDVVVEFTVKVMRHGVSAEEAEAELAAQAAPVEEPESEEAAAEAAEQAPAQDEGEAATEQA